MDREVMTLYYDRVHENVVGDAVADSEEYRKAHEDYVLMENNLREKYKNQPEVLKDYSTIMDKLMVEESIIFREMYLLGASDRERMLK